MIQDTEFFRTLVENGSDAILTIDERSEIVFANESVTRMFGYEPNEIIKEPLTIVTPERFHESHFEAVDRYIETKRTPPSAPKARSIRSSCRRSATRSRRSIPTS